MDQENRGTFGQPTGKIRPAGEKGYTDMGMDVVAYFRPWVYLILGCVAALAAWGGCENGLALGVLIVALFLAGVSASENGV